MLVMTIGLKSIKNVGTEALNPYILKTPPHPPGGYVEPLVRKNLIFMYFLTSTIFIYFDHLVPLTTLLPCPSSFSSLASTMMNILKKIHLFQMEIHIKPTFEVLISLYYSFCSKFWKQNYKISFVILLVFDLIFWKRNTCNRWKITRFARGKLHDPFCAYINV